MKSAQIRKEFLNFFKKHQHSIVESSSLIPEDDPTLLFANAGMNQFKDFFTGKRNAPYQSAVSIQKCVRAGGKHNDLENVGFTPRHHTFFEMLGNFSFGSYFKKEAIEFAWKFLTETLKIPASRLLVTVHHSDQEAALIWEKHIGVSKEKIFFLGDKDNFWEMGEIGPCGPCSEIFYDHGEQYQDQRKYDPIILDERRYVEIWNLVFMQYEKRADGTRVNLPTPCVDTGSGLERLSAAMQGQYWNYDTDLFKPIIAKIEKISKKKYQNHQTSMRVIADHTRAMTMLMTDGVIPSNEGRGYVLRRIIRRAVRHLNELKVGQTSLHLILPAVMETLQDQYTENQKNLELAVKLTQEEEQKFRETLHKGLQILDEEIAANQGKTFSGEIAFKLYDTYGFPLDLTQTLLAEKNIQLNQDEFDKAMERQKEQSRSQKQFQVKEKDFEKLYPIREQYGATDFQGYTITTLKAKLIAIEPLANEVALIFDKTPFYAESGGQVGDSGNVEGEQVHIHNTIKVIDDLFIHLTRDAKGLKAGKDYQISIDTQRRERIKKNHSATHLLQAALIQTLGAHIKQAGSLVGPDRLRFDFTHNKALTHNEIEKIEKIVNRAIQDNLKVNSMETTKEQALKMGATALFGEKYGETVRVISMDQFSQELCGGTHVDQTSQIHLFKILTEGSLASGVRRIEAITSEMALRHYQEQFQLISSLEATLAAKSNQLHEKIEQMQSELKRKNKEVEKLKDKIQSQSSQELFSEFKELRNNQKIFTVLDKVPAKEFRTLSDKFIDKHGNDVIFICQKIDDRFSFLIRTHKKNNNNFKEFLSRLPADFDCKGGGKPDMVQGSANAQKFKDFQKKLIEFFN